ncbi:hypothetical protein LOM8899_02773 [Flavimaricola marinus]|uniref:Uncharacterized protein n=1 Tax=Flavimaricola marinus TaxID=1819565 RepID=A0A238LG74_9RHOB|nr:hypothetical protein LOM8899_02773 [Flavimaricola marinus]
MRTMIYGMVFVLGGLCLATVATSETLIAVSCL